jgi:predicted nucleotidyltransferase
MASRHLPLPIFRSTAQARLLTDLYVTGADGPRSLTEISARTGIPVSTVQREVNRLARAGLVVSERFGTTRLIHADPTSPYFNDLRSLLTKAFGPLAVLEPLLQKIPRIENAYVYGSWARRYAGNEDITPRDLDVLVVGSPNPDSVYAAAREAEDELDMEVNPVIVTQDEWAQPRGLIRRIRTGPLVPVNIERAAT